jgi:hypothetical protein
MAKAENIRLSLNKTEDWERSLLQVNTNVSLAPALQEYCQAGAGRGNNGRQYGIADEN